MYWLTFFITDVNAVWSLLKGNVYIHAVRVIDRENGLVEVLTNSHNHEVIGSANGVLRSV